MTDDISVLVLDDEKAIRESLAAHFEDDDFKIFTAASAEQALAIMERNLVNVVIVDLRLPGLDGSRFVLEAYSRWKEVGFIIYTGSSEYRLETNLEIIPQVSRTVFFKPLKDLNLLSDEVRKLTKTT
jgi:DNA-binding NtrC family response regulator